MNLAYTRYIVLTALLFLLAPIFARAEGLVVNQKFISDKEIQVTFSGPVDKAVTENIQNYTIYEEPDPDIRLELSSAVLADDGKSVTLFFKEPLNTAKTHVITVHGLAGIDKTTFTVSKSYLGYLFGILISALLINNFVFTKYLGLCVFFGTSKKKDTAKGMGVVFTMVMVVSALMSWFFYNFILIPFDLNFLQIVVFIGLVSLTVQAVDTILRKVNPILFNSFGVYLVLVIANCVIIAVPLILANNNYNVFETFMLALGAGGGFLLALYLMSSVSERMQLANIPKTFKGLPIAFIVAGQFAMAFLGFSGLQLF
ncbi:NADH-quinone reductase [Desulfopila sp. IMCC35006]|uniref:electron transport complex protein RnfA n=1 Tax=Desulfopila sp. IMCC35006 TaxID=2569542 RepID=UPI0010ACB76D|nr:Rnf-Nqr domain containing protein [Desulfopila sp. IMCC35006]TKB27086.1 NADH-quinone reductase [Desulfopila sp. IMCC35006]